MFLYAGEGSADESGTTDAKGVARQLVVDQAIFVAAGATAYATKNNLLALKNKVNFIDADFTNVSGKTLIANVTLLLTYADTIKTLMTNFQVVEDDVDELATLLTDFVALEEAPAAAIDGRSMQNDKLEAEIVAARDMLTNELDVYLKPQKKKNPELHTSYTIARELDAIGSRKTADATITVAAKSVAVLYNKAYDANRLFYFTNDGPEIVEISISETATAPGSKVLVMGNGDSRQRTTYNLATSGNYVIARNLGNNATQVRVWVEE
jgi:hypothetical protein